MPQMKPMNWILLFIFMNMILMIMNIMNFFMLKIKNMNNNNKFLMNKNNKEFNNWKW